ncbi:hypothetical protein Mal4_07170 [Maioricimonas rarisocia]|uniref:Uncharacterized protein n=1 Tax=Maioricimonas rarisocia TaxID=2528026 RepID=A0A517Z1S2_9PLAN|nr:hypothetical protein [Maioricimonas rarisocia]QDU36431.1 hypothetical protein Mal4_07170 [Maioricimonas rarisocia]
MTARERWLRRNLFRLHLGQFLRSAGDALSIYLCVFGTAVLFSKLLIPALWPHVLWMAVGIVPIVGWAWWRSRVDRFSEREAIALLDRSLGTGGLLMALSEAPDAEWESRLPQLEAAWRASLPRLRPRRFASYVTVPLLFAVGACLIPVRQSQATPIEPGTVGQNAAQDLEEMLVGLDEVEALEEEEKEELREEIEKLIEETADAPLTHERWEMLDSIEQRLRLRLDEAAAAAANAGSAASLLAAAAAGDMPPMSAERKAQLEEQVLEALEEMANRGAFANASPELQKALSEMLQNGKLNPSGDAGERAELMKELSEFLNEERSKLDEMRKKANDGKCSKCGSGECEGDCDAQCSSCGGSCEGGQCKNGGSIPGRGGVTRGRGDAEMTWGDESDDQNAKFKETVLPPGFLEDPKNEVLGVTLAPPEETPDAAAPRGAAREERATAGREAWNRQLRPRHRSVVRRYFDSGK